MILTFGKKKKIILCQMTATENYKYRPRLELYWHKVYLKEMFNFKGSLFYVFLISWGTHLREKLLISFSSNWVFFSLKVSGEWAWEIAYCFTEITKKCVCGKIGLHDCLSQIHKSQCYIIIYFSLPYLELDRHIDWPYHQCTDKFLVVNMFLSK